MRQIVGRVRLTNLSALLRLRGPLFTDEDLQLLDELGFQGAEFLEVFVAHRDAVDVGDVRASECDGSPVFHDAEESLADLDWMHPGTEQSCEESVHGALQPFLEIPDEAHRDLGSRGETGNSIRPA